MSGEPTSVKPPEPARLLPAPPATYQPCRSLLLPCSPQPGSLASSYLHGGARRISRAFGSPAMLKLMSEVTRLLEAIQRGESRATDELLPLVYDELRRLAAQRMTHEKSGQTLQPTALVHEAYLRLVHVD